MAVWQSFNYHPNVSCCICLYVYLYVYVFVHLCLRVPLYGCDLRVRSHSFFFQAVDTSRMLCIDNNPDNLPMHAFLGEGLTPCTTSDLRDILYCVDGVAVKQKHIHSQARTSARTYRRVKRAALAFL